MNWKKSLKLRKARQERARRSVGKKYYFRKYLGSFKSIIKILLPALILSGAVYLLFFSAVFKISTIKVEGTKQFVNPQDVYELTKNNALQKNIFLYKPSTLEKILTTSLLGAKSYEVKKAYPNKLVIVVTERVPIAIVYRDEDAQFLVDEDGYVLGYAGEDNGDLPRIHFENEIKIGFFIDEKVVPVYLELAQLFQKEEIKVSTMSFSPKEINFQIKDGPEVLLGTNKNLKESVLAISSLLKQAKLEDSHLKRVDLRYDKVIVSFR